MIRHVLQVCSYVSADKFISYMQSVRRGWFASEGTNPGRCVGPSRPLSLLTNFAHRSNICCTRDWRLSDSKCWNGRHEWVKVPLHVA